MSLVAARTPTRIAAAATVGSEVFGSTLPRNTTAIITSPPKPQPRPALTEAPESGNAHGVDERGPQPLEVEGEEGKRKRRDGALLDPVLREPGGERRGDHREPETRRDAEEERRDRRRLHIRPHAFGKSMAPLHAGILRPAGEHSPWPRRRLQATTARVAPNVMPKLA